MECVTFNYVVECTLNLNCVFGSLADPTRRDILRRVAERELSIGEIAADYGLTFAAVSKHLKILERAKLVVKRREGRQQFVQASPAALKDVSEYLRQYEAFWNARLDALDEYLKKEDTK